MTTKVKHIGILLFSDVEELDVVGPWEALSWWARNFPEDGYAVSCISKSGGLVQCAKGLVVQAQHSYATAPPLKVLIYPGGRCTRAHLQDEAQLDWVRQQRRDVPLLVSVCTGALVYPQPASSPNAQQPRTGARRTRSPKLTRLSKCGHRNVSSTTETSSPQPACPPVSTWHYTSWPA